MGLDTRVPESISFPIRPAGVVLGTSCPHDFDVGLMVGYGGLDFQDIAPTPFSSGSTRRNWAAANGWQRDTYDDGVQTYDNDWILETAPLFFTGPAKGDSGGPVLAPPYDLVCGVDSANVPIAKFVFPTFIGYLRASYAALDSADISDALADILMDKSRTYFLGEKPIVSDRDGDHVDDSEDNCPDAANPDQRDTDGDGKGDRCDNCFRIANDQLDSNLDDETKVYGPKPDGLDGRPQLDPGLPDDYITTHYPGDVCDGHPLTLMTPSVGKYDPVGSDQASRLFHIGERSIRCTHVAGLACPPPPVPATHIQAYCDLPHGNVIAAESFVGNDNAPGLSNNLSQRSIVRALACRCAPGDGDCGATCDRSNVAMPPIGMMSWRTMTLDDVPSQTTITGNSGPPGFASTGKFREYHAMIGFDAFSAHAETLGWRYWRDLDGIPPPTEAPDPVTMFDGVVWSWVQTHQIAAAGYPAPSDPPTGDPGHDWPLRQNVSRAHVYEQAKSVVNDPPCFKEKMWIRPPDLRDCPMCGAGVFFRITLDAVDPPPSLVSPDRFDNPAEGFMPPGVVNVMRNPNLRIVTASDTLAWATGSVRAAIVSNVDQTVLFGLSSGPDGSLTLGGGGIDRGAPSAAAARTGIASSFLVALSSRRQDIAFLVRDDAGNPIQELRTFDFDLGQAVIKPLHLGAHRLVDPVALTYRADDDAYYVLDQTHDPDPRAILYRIPRGNTLEVVGSWGRRGELANVGLTTGSDGTLVFSTWSDEKYAVAVLDLTRPFPDEGKHKGQDIAKRRIRVAELRFGSGSVVVPAYRNLESVTLVVHDKGDDMAVRIVGDAPKGKGDIDDGDVDDLAAAF